MGKEKKTKRKKREKKRINKEHESTNVDFPLRLGEGRRPRLLARGIIGSKLGRLVGTDSDLLHTLDFFGPRGVQLVSYVPFFRLANR